MVSKGAKFRFDGAARAAPAGNTVTNEPLDPSVAVMLSTTAVADAGTPPAPPVPAIRNERVCPGPSFWASHPPTAVRESSTRYGTTAWNAVLGAACTFQFRMPERCGAVRSLNSGDEVEGVGS